MRSWHIAVNIVKRVLGTPKSFLVSILFPVVVISIIISLFGTMNWNSSTTITYANLDKGKIGNELVSHLHSIGTYDLKLEASEEACKKAIISTNTSVAFVIPADYSEQMLTGEPTAIRFYHMAETEVSASLKLHLEQQSGSLAEVTRALLVSGMSGSALEEKLFAFITEKNQSAIGVVRSPLKHAVPSSLFLVIGFILMFLMSSVSRSVSLLLEDRRQFTMARIYAAPVRKWEIAFGNFLGSFIVGSLLVLGFTAFTMYVTNVDYGMAFLPLFVILETFILAAIGLSSLAGSLIQNSNTLSNFNNLLITPTCMLGGCFWPVEFMPQAMQKLAYFTPQYWTIDAAKKLSIGNTLTDVSGHLGILFLFACVFLAFGSVVLVPSNPARD